MIFLFRVILFVGVVILVAEQIEFLDALNLVVGHGITPDVDSLLTFNFFALP